MQATDAAIFSRNFAKLKRQFRFAARASERHNRRKLRHQMKSMMGK